MIGNTALVVLSVAWSWTLPAAHRMRQPWREDQEVTRQWEVPELTLKLHAGMAG